MRAFAFFVSKKFDFSEFMVCLHGQGRGVIFSRFCADVFYGLDPQYD